MKNMCSRFFYLMLEVNLSSNWPSLTHRRVIIIFGFICATIGITIILTHESHHSKHDSTPPASGNHQ